MKKVRAKIIIKIRSNPNKKNRIKSFSNLEDYNNSIYLRFGASF